MHRLAWPVSDYHINRIKQMYFFVYGFFHLFVRFAHIVVNRSVSFFKWMYCFLLNEYITFIYSTLDVQLGCFQLEGILNNVIWKFLYMFRCMNVCTFIRHISKSRITEFQDVYGHFSWFSFPQWLNQVPFSQPHMKVPNLDSALSVCSVVGILLSP